MPDYEWRRHSVQTPLCGDAVDHQMLTSLRLHRAKLIGEAARNLAGRRLLVPGTTHIGDAQDA